MSGPTPVSPLPRSLQGWQEQSGRGIRLPLGKPIARYLRPTARRWQFHCMIVAAQRGDGITTASEQAERDARGVLGSSAVVRLTGEDLPRLAIADLIPARTVVRAATRAGVGPGLSARWRSGRAVLGAVAAFLLAAGLSLFTSITADGTATAVAARNAVTDPWYLAVAVLAGLVVLSVDSLLHLREHATGERLERVVAALGQTPPIARDRFAALLATALLEERGRRCLIVDDYTRLDPLTQAVLRQALAAAPVERRELWIVFESAAPTADSPADRAASGGVLIGPLGAHVLAERAGNPGGSPTAPALRSYATLLFELAHLTPQQRDQLAEQAVRAGRPARPGYLLICDILGGQASAPQRAAFERAWPPAAVRADATLQDAVTLLYLLCLSAPPGQAVAFLPNNLTTELAATGVRHEVLRRVLNTRPTLYTLRRRLDHALEIFAQFVESDRGKPLVPVRLSPAIQDALVGRQADYGLPAADLVHLFWALYRFGGRWADHAAWLAPQVRHLREAADPAVLDLPEATAAFVAALLSAADACLDLGRPGTAGDLLDRAFDLAAGPGFPLDTAELRRRARGLYAVTADPALLTRAAASAVAAGAAAGERVGGSPEGEADRSPAAVGSTAAADHVSPRVRRPSAQSGYSLAADLLLDLYRQATPHVDGLPELCAVEPALSIDLRLQAVWLAFSLQPLTGSALPASLPLSRTIVYAHLTLPMLAQRALDEADAQLTPVRTGDWSPAALGAVTNALWCLALVDETLTGPILARVDADGIRVDERGVDSDVTLSPEQWSDWMSVVDVELVKGLDHGLYLARNTTVDGPSYAYASTRGELRAVVVAAALRIRMTRTGLQRTQEKRLEAIILEGCRELGIPTPAPRSQAASGRLAPAALRPLAERVAKRMQVIEVTWAALGYPRAAAALNTRRVQFLAGLPGERTPAQTSALGDRGRNDLLGLIANLAVAGDPATHLNVGAEIASATIGRLLTADRFGESLAAQLCLLAVRYGGMYDDSVDFSQHLRYLLDPPTDGGASTRLDALLAAIAEDELDYTFLALVNAASAAARGTGDQPERARHILGALHRRLAEVTDPVAARNPRTRLDMYELMHAIQANRPPCLEATLDLWRDRTDQPVYAFVLCLLIQSQGSAVPERLRQEAAAVLRTPRPYYSESGITLLANAVARTEEARRLTLTAAELADLVRVLRERAHQVGVWSQLQLSEAIETLRQLFRLDSANAFRYRAPMLDLQRTSLRLFEEQRLSRLLVEQQYAILLRAYYAMFQEFLPVVEDPGDDPPTPFTGQGGRSGLSLRFLQALFDQAEQDLPRADAQSRTALLRVLNLLAAVPDMPTDMVELLRRHREFVQRSGGPTISLSPER